MRNRLKTLAIAGVSGGILLLAVLLTSCGDGQDTEVAQRTEVVEIQEGAAIAVNSAADTNERDGKVTLREAILLATGGLAVAELDSAEAAGVSGHAGPESADTITFGASAFPAQGAVRIALSEPLPALAGGSDAIAGSQAAVVVDGGNQTFECLTVASSSNNIKGLQIQNCRVGVMIQPGAQKNVIGGPAPGEANIISGNDQGILIGGTGATDNIVRGNLIGVDASGTGPLGNRNGVEILAEGRGNVIGGSDPGDRNIISGNKGVGITIWGIANIVQGNYIGTDSNGTARIPNGMEGIWVAPGAKENIVGGGTAQERNVISGNSLFGLSIAGPGADGNVVKGNYIGLDPSGTTAVPNTHGLVLDDSAQENIIGGPAPGEGNVISGNGTGVLIRGVNTSGNVLIGNLIGTDASGSELLPNADGIWLLGGAHDNTIGEISTGGGNVTAGNKLFGVHVEGPDTIGNTIRGNSIYANTVEGIRNADGGNTDLEPPTLVGRSPLTGTACPDCTVDIYSDAGDQGKVYEGSTVADADGSFTFEGSPSGANVTATATDGQGNTSSFSRPLLGVTR